MGAQCQYGLSILGAYALLRSTVRFALLMSSILPMSTFTLRSVYPLIGPGMRVSHVDLSGLTLPYLLIRDQAGQPLTLAHPYGSEPIYT